MNRQIQNRSLQAEFLSAGVINRRPSDWGKDSISNLYWTSVARMEYEKSASNKVARSHDDSCAVSNRSNGGQNEAKVLASLLFDYGDHVSSEYCTGSRSCRKTAILPGQDPQHGD